MVVVKVKVEVIIASLFDLRLDNTLEHNISSSFYFCQHLSFRRADHQMTSTGQLTQIQLPILM